MSDPQQPEDLRECLKGFGIEDDFYDIQPLGNGLINDTYQIVRVEEPLYVLQRINTDVFGNVEDVMRNMEKAMNLLQSSSYHSPELIPTPEGYAYLHWKSDYWRLTTYIPGTATYNIAPTLFIAEEAGRIIGTFHRLLQDVPMHQFRETIPRFQDLEYRLEQFNEAQLAGKRSRMGKAKEALNFVEAHAEMLTSMNHSDIPIRVCHNDTKLNNILFNTSTGKAVCLIDLDTVMPGHFFMDFGDAIRTVVNAAEEGVNHPEKIVFRKDYFKAFLQGLNQSGIRLSKKEIDSLYLGMVYMPFLHGLRALTDYLNGDIYYKTTYENENLDRCLGLFHWVKCVLAEEDFVKKEIQKFFSFPE